MAYRILWLEFVCPVSKLVYILPATALIAFMLSGLASRWLRNGLILQDGLYWYRLWTWRMPKYTLRWFKMDQWHTGTVIILGVSSEDKWCLMTAVTISALEDEKMACYSGIMMPVHWQETSFGWSLPLHLERIGLSEVKYGTLSFRISTALIEAAMGYSVLDIQWVGRGHFVAFKSYVCCTITPWVCRD